MGAMALSKCKVIEEKSNDSYGSNEYHKFLIVRIRNRSGGSSTGAELFSLNTLSQVILILGLDCVRSSERYGFKLLG
jgi:hypothetical protein